MVSFFPRCIFCVGVASSCRVLLIVQQIRADFLGNRAFDDKSMKFGTHLEKPLRKIFGYRAIAYFARNKNGRRFQNGRHPF